MVLAIEIKEVVYHLDMLENIGFEFNPNTQAQPVLEIGQIGDSSHWRAWRMARSTGE